MRLTEEELVRWGRRIGARVETPVFLGLRGPLGAGKSVLARAVARGAGVEGAVPSPTFNLLFHYDATGGRKVTHVDLYRIRDPEELRELGWEELGGDDEIVLVEWPERAGGRLPAHRWEVTLGFLPDPRDLREVEVVRIGSPPPLPGFPMAIARGGQR